MLELFDKLVTPILNYGSECWGFYKSTAIETVHLQFCKKILGVKQSTQNDFVYGELGRIDYQSRRYVTIIKYWFKVITSEENKLIKQSYNMMLNDIVKQPLKQNWALSVKNLLSRLGFMDVWVAQGVGNKEAFLEIFKLRVKDISSKGNTGRAVSSGSSAIVLGSIVNSLLFKGMCENILILCSTMACFLSM